MTNILLFLIALLVQEADLTQKKVSMESQAVIEVVIYQLKDGVDRSREVLVKQVNEAVADFPGFVSRKVYQSKEQPGIYMDFVHWESLEQAKDATQKAQSNEKLTSFFSAIEKVDVFHHFVEVK